MTDEQELYESGTIHHDSFTKLRLNLKQRFGTELLQCKRCWEIEWGNFCQVWFQSIFAALRG